MNCLVTGAAGFIGSTLCDELLIRGHHVIGLDRFAPYYARDVKERNVERALQNHKFRLVEGDIADLAITLLPDIDVVFHLAAQPGVRSSWATDFEAHIRDNLRATQRLLEACRAATPRRLVYASSSSIFGNATDLPVREETSKRPVSPYGVTKLAAEQLCDVYGEAFGITIVSLRYFTVYGPRQRPDMAFHRFIRGALTGQAITVFGDGFQSRDFTYVADAVEATIAAGMGGRGGEKYNIGGGAVWTVRDILAAIERLSGKQLDVRFDQAVSGDVISTATSTSKAHRELGYNPVTDVEHGLAQEIDWMRTTLGT